MKRTASAQRLLITAARCTVNGARILARLVAAISGEPDAEATGADVAEALPSRVKPQDTRRRRLGRDPEVAK